MNGNKKTPVKGDDIKSMLTNSPQVSGGSGSTKKKLKHLCKICQTKVKQTWLEELAH